MASANASGLSGSTNRPLSDYFGYRCCARSNNRLSGSHRLEKYDTEAFLGARQAKKVTPVVFRGQGIRADVAEPMQVRSIPSSEAELSQSLVLRAAADNSEF